MHIYVDQWSVFYAASGVIERLARATFHSLRLSKITDCAYFLSRPEYIMRDPLAAPSPNYCMPWSAVHHRNGWKSENSRQR